MRLEESLYSAEIPLRRFGIKSHNKYTCYIKYWDFPTIGGNNFSGLNGMTERIKIRPLEPFEPIVPYSPILPKSSYPKSEPLHKDFEGNSWGKSFGLSTDYIKEIPQGTLHVHSPQGFITGANLTEGSGKKKQISNYDACMLDIQIGKITKDNIKW